MSGSPTTEDRNTRIAGWAHHGQLIGPMTHAQAATFAGSDRNDFPVPTELTREEDTLDQMIQIGAVEKVEKTDGKQ